MTEMTEAGWRGKAKKLVEQLSREAYLEANTLKNGKMRKRHRQYVVPAEAAALIDCLDRDDEHTAKALMMYDYHLEKAWNRSLEGRTQ